MVAKVKLSILRKWPADRWLSFAAVVVAVCALVISIHESRLARRSQRLATLPFLNVSLYWTEEGAGYIFENFGLGPAFIQWFQVKVDGEPEKSWPRVVQALGLQNIPSFSFSVPYPDTIKQAGATSRIFWAPNGLLKEKLLQQRSRIEIEVCYCSFFDECWLEATNIQPPKEVDSCDPRPKMRFGAPSGPSVP